MKTPALIAASAAFLVPAAAAACGGFFCNQVPVDQTGENIVFAMHEDGTTEAHVQILYAGEAEDFAWIVPTPSEPEVGVSTDLLFTTLNRNLAPRWQTIWEYVGDCWGGEQSNGGFGAEDDGALPPSPDPSDSGVTVVQQSSVGPYDFAVLQAVAVEPLFDWLTENDYDIPEDTSPFVEPYVMMGGDVHFVAFRLSKDRDVGDLQPVLLAYESTKPSVPIRLTAIASQPDMGVRVHVIADHRAVPENYLHVHVNEAAIDWMSGGSNYDELVTAAMDEAGGQGFTTEFSGSTDMMDGLLFREGQYDTEALALIEDPIAFFDEMQRQGFQASGQLMSLLQAFIILPDDWIERGYSARDFYNCLSCNADEVNYEDFDPVAFAMALQQGIVEPLEHAQSLFDGDRVVTRLYTTLSAEEMTNDPIFAMNPDLEDVSNIHTATLVFDCERGTATTRLEDGREVVTWIDGSPTEAADMPAAETIEETGESGQPVLVMSQRDEIDSALTAHNRSVGVVAEPYLGPEISGGGGCATSQSHRIGWPILGLALLFLPRRKIS